MPAHDLCTTASRELLVVACAPNPVIACGGRVPQENQNRTELSKNELNKEGLKPVGVCRWRWLSSWLTPATPPRLTPLADPFLAGRRLAFLLFPRGFVLGASCLVSALTGNVGGFGTHREVGGSITLLADAARRGVSLGSCPDRVAHVQLGRQFPPAPTCLVSFAAARR